MQAQTIFILVAFFICLFFLFFFYCLLRISSNACELDDQDLRERSLGKEERIELRSER